MTEEIVSDVPVATPRGHPKYSIPALGPEVHLQPPRHVLPPAAVLQATVQVPVEETHSPLGFGVFARTVYVSPTREKVLHTRELGPGAGTAVAGYVPEERHKLFDVE